jgi:hypothetical protein
MGIITFVKNHFRKHSGLEPLPEQGPPDDEKSFTDASRGISQADMEWARAQAAFEARSSTILDAEIERQSYMFAEQEKEIRNFCEQGVCSGLIKAEWAEKGISQFMKHLSRQKGVIEFSDGRPKKTSVEWFKDFLREIQKFNN